MYLLYNLALLAYFAVCAPLVGYRVWRRGKPVGRIGDRLGRPPPDVNPDCRPSIWIHAVSVGEVLAARALVGLLKETYPAHRLLVSTTTTTGQHVARQLGPAVDAVFYAPLDFPPCVAGTLDRVAPELLVLVDTEVWPNLLRACRRRGVRTLIVNGRISDRSYRGYRLVRGFMRRALAGVDRICAQNDLWSRRFQVLGVPRERLTVTGSLKFDAADDAAADGDADALLHTFAFAAGRRVIVAASTLRGEEQPVLRAFGSVRRTFADALLIIAPRHPERFA
ncbi:MAG: 3-deoxy-D-manno-octulosonic acid transferase, partial [Acidobacteria bacterium]|nr:3-deoxy-D-manno-octulosonic acid transferase [Acidobacteriota bacterium]